jgi:acyl carrier protein
MTSEREVFGTVRECVAEVFGIPPESITPGTRLGDDLGADSLDLAEIFSKVEARSGIVVKPSRLTAVATVGDACAALAE